ncbi:unnamed protein product [Allacma fusca]|uniref:Uncharacterized protein n=1 Tax=Allacma fusca TaxID=39272 RepID=A0A8J2P529_9HEXA|nr:unnamed protein product [Allacma fusca]
MSLDELPDERVLGMTWKPTGDVFYFVLQFHKVPSEVLTKGRSPTKREIASIIPSIFDIFGFLAHFTIQAKILKQEVWRMGGEWDDPIPDSLRSSWDAWLDDLHKIELLEIPRCYFQDLEDETKVELHTFTDDSQQAKAVVIYARFVQRELITIRFINGRSWGTPLKPVSIPRLELQAALLGSRLATFVQENHNLKFSRVQFWTDSSTVLCWLRSDARKFPTFIANRVGEIEETTNATQWRWVPTKQNPADDGTRNNAPADLTTNCRWLTGPEFLRRHDSEWPCDLQLKKNPPSTEDLE